MRQALVAFGTENSTHRLPWLSSHSTARLRMSCRALRDDCHDTAAFVLILGEPRTPWHPHYPEDVSDRELMILLTGLWTVELFAWSIEDIPAGDPEGNNAVEDVTLMMETLPEPVDVHYRETLYDTDGEENFVAGICEGRALALHNLMDHIQASDMNRYRSIFIDLPATTLFIKQVFLSLLAYADITALHTVNVRTGGQRLVHSAEMGIAGYHRYWLWEPNHGHLGFVTWGQGNLHTLPDGFEFMFNHEQFPLSSPPRQ